MKRVLLGKTGLSVYPLCLGCMNFGSTTDESTSLKILDEYYSLGGNFLDTSCNYAHWNNADGASEEVIGKWLRSRRDIERDKLVIATKVGYDHYGADQGLSREQIKRWCDVSLKRMGVDYVDILYAHVDDMQTPQEETMEAFDSLIKSGKVRAVGCSNYYTWRIEKANECARKNGWAEFALNQQKYTYLFAKNGCEKVYPLNENAGPEKLAYLADANMPLVAYSCLAGGGYEDEARLPDFYIKGERLDLLRANAKALGCTCSQLVLAYVASIGRANGMPQAVPLFSTSREGHLTDAAKALEIVIPDSMLAEMIAK